MQPIDKVAEIQSRLDTTKSDPVWLNKAMAELREMLLNGAGMQLAYEDIVAVGAMQSMMRDWKGPEKVRAGEMTEVLAGQQLANFATWATRAGIALNAARERRISEAAARNQTQNEDASE